LPAPVEIRHDGDILRNDGTDDPVPSILIFI
jgi:hypothetical protein